MFVLDVPSSSLFGQFVHFSLVGVFTGSDTHVRMLEDCIQETILEQNKLAACSDRSVSGTAKTCRTASTPVLHIYL